MKNSKYVHSRGGISVALRRFQYFPYVGRAKSFKNKIVGVVISRFEHRRYSVTLPIWKKDKIGAIDEGILDR